MRENIRRAFSFYSPRTLRGVAVSHSSRGLFIQDGAIKMTSICEPIELDAIVETYNMAGVGTVWYDEFKNEWVALGVK